MKFTAHPMFAALCLFLVLTAILTAPPNGFTQEKPLATVYVAHAAATLTDVPYYIAKEKRFYRDENLEVTSLFVQGGARGAQVLVAGSVDFSLGLGSGTRAALAGVPIKAIFGFNDKPYFFLYGRPESGVNRPADLRGKKIAVTSIGSSTDFAARAIVRHLGLNPEKDVSILATGGGTNVWSAIQSGAVQAAILWPPFDLAAQKLGMKKILYLGDVLDLPGGGVVASDTLLKDNPERVKRFLRATLKGLRFVLDENNRNENAAIIMRVFQLDKEVALSTYDFLRTIQTSDGIISQKAIQSDLEISLLRMKDPKILALPREEQVKRMYDFGLLREVLKEQKAVH
ncbi:MAG: ABC transporter substrate-binding protein [Deltaproteobacteria bacterium]|nr:ABC transporter substrate-binding protein [Deltaproteobacteria bacterium]